MLTHLIHAREEIRDLELRCTGVSVNLMFGRIAVRKGLLDHRGPWKMAWSDYSRQGRGSQSFFGLELAREILKETDAKWDRHSRAVNRIRKN